MEYQQSGQPAAFGQPELRIFGFQGFQLAVEPVVFGIGHAGRVQSVVFAGVAVERLHEGADALLGGGPFLICSIRIRNMFEIKQYQIPHQCCGRRSEQYPCADGGDFAQGAFLAAATQAVDNQRD